MIGHADTDVSDLPQNAVARVSHLPLSPEEGLAALFIGLLLPAPAAEDKIDRGENTLVFMEECWSPARLQQSVSKLLGSRSREALKDMYLGHSVAGFMHTWLTDGRDPGAQQVGRCV